jgi:hypothetical protein
VADAGVTDAFLRLLAERACADPAYLGWVVRRHAESKGRATATVLNDLGVTDDLGPDFLVSLRPTGEHFGGMLRAICIRFGADERALLAVLREVEVIDAFGANRPREVGSGLLMAARMRENESRATENPETRHVDEESGDGGGDAR